MSDLRKLLKRGVAVTDEHVVLVYQEKDGSLYCQPCIEDRGPDGDRLIGRWEGVCTLIRLHYGRQVIAREDLAQIKAEFTRYNWA